ncbi:CaiB/BaiF CoA transferase family protein [Parasphingorhabdus sp.]|uniref:CaiB/BaiF CoA transferase family protein n=1 Tax=Parasphingorhabdus sp. TaxID=2709688 RepID=UPI003A94E749
MTDKKDHNGPLSGIRVIDLTSMVFGPYCTQIMADMGADIIKIEPPGGDQTRYINAGPAPGLGGVFVNVNRGKRSIMLDLHDEQDKAALRKLIEGADVFIHSMRGKAISRIGFDYAAVSAIKPDIVYSNCYGYGRRGPDADLPAYDDTIQAECGLTHVQGLMTGSPDFVATIMADKVAGLTALYATMMALFHRERTGEGQEVEIAMFETMASFMLVEHASGKLFTPELGPANYHRVVSPNRKPYKTKDGYIAALVYNDRHWNAFVGAVKPAWNQPEFATLELRAKQIDRIYGLLGETFATRTTQEWLDLLRELNVPAAPLRTTDELFDNPHLNATGFFETVASDYGDIRYPGVPTWFSKTPGKVAGPTPALDEHGEEILNEIGLAGTGRR